MSDNLPLPIFSHFLVSGAFQQGDINVQEEASLLVQLPLGETHFDAAITKLTMPDGVKIYQSKCHEPRFHTFVGVHEDGKRFYGGSLVFLEELSSVTDLNLPVSNETTSTMNSEDQGDEDLTRPKQSREKKCSRISSDSGVSVASHLGSDNVAYASKSIALISHLALGECFREILLAILKVAEDTDMNAMASVVYTLLYKYKCQYARSLLILHELTPSVFVYFPGAKEFSIFDYELMEVFRIFSPKNFLSLLSNAMMDGQIIILSSDSNKLVLLAESLTICLYPFFWPHTYVPMVPSSMHTLLDAPIPFIMGIKMTDNLVIPEVGQVCIADVDKGQIRCSRKLPPLPFTDKLLEELKGSVISRWDRLDLQRKSSTPFGSDEFVKNRRLILSNVLIRELILNAIVQNLVNFEKYIKTSESDEKFDRSKFLQQCPKHRCEFMAAFTLTQVFANFVDMNIDGEWLPATPKELYEDRLNAISRRFPREDSGYIPAASLLDLEQETCASLNKRVVMGPTVEQLEPCEQPSPGESAFSVLARRTEFLRATHTKAEKFLLSPLPSQGRHLSVDTRFLSAAIAQPRILEEWQVRCRRLVVKLSREQNNDDLQSSEDSVVESLCHVLEIIWASGFIPEKVKSPLWHHLTGYKLVNYYAGNTLPIEDLDLSHSIIWCIQQLRLKGSHDAGAKIKTSDMDFVDLVEIIRQISKLAKEVEDDCYAARAFLRYCLEYGILAEAIQQLLSCNELASALYRKDALLRQDEGKEKVLMYMRVLSLRKFRCFTSFISESKLTYVVKVRAKWATKKGSGENRSYIRVYGDHGMTEEITLTYGKESFSFQCRNLGNITCLNLGCVEAKAQTTFSQITIYNGLTRKTYCFDCSLFEKQKGKSRTFFATFVACTVVTSDEYDPYLNPKITTDIIPDRFNSYTIGYIEDIEVRDNFWYAVNEFCELLSKPESRPGAFLYAFLQPCGIGDHLESVLSDGMKTQLFKKKHLWDVIVGYIKADETVKPMGRSGTRTSFLAKKGGADSAHQHRQQWSVGHSIQLIEDNFSTQDQSSRFKLWILFCWNVKCLKRSLIILGHFLKHSKKFHNEAFIRQPEGLSFICQQVDRLERMSRIPKMPALDYLTNTFTSQPTPSPRDHSQSTY